MAYAPIHLHSNKGSFLDSMVRIPALIKRVKEMGFRHCAITDHGSLSGIVDFYDEAIANKIVPILGCEFYIAGGHRTDKSQKNVFHIIILAKNKIGYRNLIKLSTISNLEGKYMNKGRIDDEVLEKYKQGLICMTACLGGKIPRAIVGGNIKLASEFAGFYQRMFGEDFIFEIMDNGMDEQYMVNDVLIRLSSKMNVPIVMTNDVHYMDATDENSHAILKRIHYNKKDDSGKFTGTGYFLRSETDFLKKYKKYMNTDVVTDKIESYNIYNNKRGQFFMPKIKDASRELETQCLLNFPDKTPSDKKQKYMERLKHELNIINDLGFPDYFLIVKDAIDWCRSNNILVGPGRGSSGGSIVSYLLNITSFDPMNESCALYFERFLNPHRASPPDIDVDITDKDRVVTYLKDKYSSKKVVNIGATSTLGTKDVINNIARVMNVSQWKVKPLLDMIPSDTMNTSNEQLYKENEAYRALVDGDDTLMGIYDHAIKLEGLCKNFTVHASGIIISPKDIDMPLNKYKKTIFTQYDMILVEKLGYVKFDFLGLKTLRIIEQTMKKINKSMMDCIKQGNSVDERHMFNIENINYWKPDKKTMKLINNTQTTCVFQWESDGYKNLIKRVHPDTFSELIDLNTLYRPGPMESGLTDQYIRRKRGEEPVDVLHPSLKDKLKRQGLPLFQEEIMMVCREIAGFTMAEADTMRKAIGKKKKALLDEQKEKFINGCLKMGKMKKDKVVDLWWKIEKFARYSWNLSHGLAYTIISYWTAYLSAHHPAEFFAANMDIRHGDFERLLININEARLRGIEVISPNINLSDEEHVVTDGKIIMTFGSIKGVGDVAKWAILEERKKNGDYKSFDDFCERVSKNKCNSVMKESLIYAGVFDGGDSDYIRRRKSLLRLIVNKKNKNKIKCVEDLTEFKMLREEHNRIGFYIKNNPIDYWKLHIFNANTTTVEIVHIHTHIDKKSRKMCFINATDYKDGYDFVVFSKQYAEFKQFLTVGNIVAINYDINDSGRGYKLNIITPLVIDDEMAYQSFMFFKPVVTSEMEMSNNLSFGRFIMHKEDNGLVVFYDKDGKGKVDNSKIEGYRII